MDSKNNFNLHSLATFIFAISTLLFSANSMATSSYTVKNNFPANPEKCTVGSIYDDGESFIYECVSAGKLCAKYCLVLSEDDNTHVSLVENERVTYDQEATLRCEKTDGKNALLSQLLEDVTTETIADSKVPYCQ